MAPEVTAVLTDRGVIELSGPDATSLLQRLITNDVEHLGPGQARYAALLSPQGKITVDFLVIKDRDSLLLEVPGDLAAELIKKLKMYRLRAKVEVTDRSDTVGVIAWPGGDAPVPVLVAYDDPRAPGLWRRALIDKAGLTPCGDDTGRWAYREQRIKVGVPEGGLDFLYGDTFPHEANLDRLNGVDFKKGCYVGQEVVSRVHHRGTARKRVVQLRFDGEPPPVGSDIMLNDLAIGTMGSSVDGVGLGLLRLDRAEEGGGALSASGIALRVEVPPAE